MHDALWLFRFAHEAGDEEDVVYSGEDGEERYDGVGCGKIDAVELGEDGGDEDEDDGGDLDEGAGLAEPGGLKAAKTGHQRYRHRDRDDQYVPADDGSGHPKRYGQVPSGIEKAGDRQHNECRRHQKFVGDRVDDRAELGLLLHTACDETVDAVGYSRDREDDQSTCLAAVDQRRREHWN